MTESPEIESDPLFIDVPEVIEGPRITLRPLSPGEGDALWEAIEESRVHLQPWQQWQDLHKTPRHSELAIRRARINFARRETLSYGVWRREDGRLLGRAQLQEIFWRERSFGLSYWLRASATGEGFATEAGRLLCRLAFEGLAARRVGVLVDTLNERSIGVAKRLNFRLEGTIRNERLNTSGEPQDTLVFGLTSDDYSSVSVAARRSE